MGCIELSNFVPDFFYWRNRTYLRVLEDIWEGIVEGFLIERGRDIGDTNKARTTTEGMSMLAVPNRSFRGNFARQPCCQKANYPVERESTGTHYGTKTPPDQRPTNPCVRRVGGFLI